MIQGRSRTWDVPTGNDDPAGGVHAVRWAVQVCRECRNEYLRYWEGRGVPERLVVGNECFHLGEDMWAPDFRRDSVVPSGA